MNNLKRQQNIHWKNLDLMMYWQAVQTALKEVAPGEKTHQTPTKDMLNLFLFILIPFMNF